MSGPTRTEPAVAGDAWLVPDWPAPARVCAAVSTRQGPGISPAPFERFNLGARNGDAPAAVEHNRRATQMAWALPHPPHWLQQVHGTEVAAIDRPASLAEPRADAAWTATPGQPLAILTADCLPVLFCAADGSAVAAAHAGWRGLAAGVLEATLQALPAAAVPPLAWLGPCIGARSYEVGEEVHAAFVDRDAGAAGHFVATRPGHWLCDLAGLARRRLRQAGLTQVYGGGFDTLVDSRFYSYRRDAAGSGRFASLIWLV
jgi:polyphenol oxidase